MRDQRGLALIMVLWSVTLMALLAAMAMQRSTADLRLARNLAAGAAAELAADAAVRLAVADIVAGEVPWPPDPAPRAQVFAGAHIVLAVEDETGRIDLNVAEPTLLAVLMIELGAPEDEAGRLAAAIADYRDPDGVAREGGAEDADYEAAGLPLGAGDAPFADPAELGRVLGMPIPLRRAMERHVTTLTGLPEPARGSSHGAVRRALLRRDAIEREGAAGQPGSRSTRLVVLPSTGASNTMERRIARLTASAETRAGARFVREAVFDIGSEPPTSKGAPPSIQVVHWRRGRSMPGEDY